MHHIEPYYHWRDNYKAEADKYSPFYKRIYSEFYFENKIYNYYIHPQWDNFGSETLYIKILYVNYTQNFACLELIGEWNDALYNDIMFLKNNVLDKLFEQGVYKIALIGENVLNFHADDNSYYEAIYDEQKEHEGWLVGLNFNSHLWQEMQAAGLHYFFWFGKKFNDFNWRAYQPKHLLQAIEDILYA